eukprot:gene16183-1668_t
MIRQVPDIAPLAALAARLESSQEQRFAAIAALRSKLGAKYTRQSWVETTICSSLAARGAFSTGVLVPVMWLVVWSIAWTGFAESAVKMAAKANANTSANATLSAAGGWAAAVTVFEDAEVGNEPYLQHI